MNKIVNIIDDSNKGFEIKSNGARFERGISERIGLTNQQTNNILDEKNSRLNHRKNKELTSVMKGDGDLERRPLEKELIINKNSGNCSNNKNEVEIYRCDLVYVSSRKKVPITPVESCELQPIVILRDKMGKLWDDDDENPENPVINGSASIYYRWSRGPSRAVCTFHPSQVAMLQCATTLRCFCGVNCYKQGFAQLRRFYEVRGMSPISPHPNSHTYGVPCRPFQFNDPDNSLRDRDDAHVSLLLKTGLVHISTDQEEWTPVCDQRNYLPVSEDVGHQLKLEVFLVFNSGSDRNSEFFERSLSEARNSSETYSQIITACCVPNLPQAPPRCILTVPSSQMNGVGANQNTCTAISNSRFKVFSWNILAEIYASQEAFPHCDAYMLSWSYRKTRIIVEILSHQPDIVCLQEVQTEHFDDFFKPVLQQYGYEGVYKQKTTEIFTSGSGRRKDGKYTMDGCATFYKTNKFIAKENYSLEFSALIKEATHRTLPSEVKNNPAAIKRLLKDNVAVVILLEYRQNDTIGSDSNHPIHNQLSGNSSGVNNRGIVGMSSTNLVVNSVQNQSGVLISSSNNQIQSDSSKKPMNSSAPLQVIIANTHIVANPEANDVKIWQAQTLVSVLEEYLHDCYRRQPVLPGLIICGDFNSTPDSALYRLLATGTCEKTHKDLAMDRYGLLSDLQLGHSMRLRSAYSMAKAMVEGHNPSILVSSTESLEPVFTNYTPNYLGCLDYVFYTDERLRLGGVLELLDEEALIREAAALQLPDWSLPNPQRPSDHLPLLTEFEWNI
ncbi:endonuclease exonuclease phosphatase family [Cryptosporidium sp. chipmunk genotype I]|uniref:endonuclease exonuclease phosphatase family n=1 Tax=Cryptosporidium sp. chipmunk genotype I TaxID=1280935 RepID=UPI00351A0689|nr:endonuclease exonuclease phosphatase family [Cryptosporidium sp. chipmunk genotype I]